MDGKTLGDMPANPVVLDGETASNERLHPVIAIGLTKREAFAMAVTYFEADSMVGSTGKSAADFLGMPEAEYRGAEHYPIAIAKAKAMFADALLAELAREY